MLLFVTLSSQPWPDYKWQKEYEDILFSTVYLLISITQWVKHGHVENHNKNIGF